MRPGTWRDRSHRLTVRVPLLVLLYVTPTLLGLDDAIAKPIREIAAGGLLIAVTAWVSTQGRRRPPGEGG